jgi:hypothetical protein
VILMVNTPALSGLPRHILTASAATSISGSTASRLCKRENFSSEQRDDWTLRPRSARRGTVSSAAELRGRLAGNFSENAIEMGKRLEADIVGDFADATISIEQ